MTTFRGSFLAVLALAATAAAPCSGAQARTLGITPDSEYLLFVVDNSGSMRRYEWDRVIAMMRETIGMYPGVRGLQIINDEGEHLLISFRNEWIPITPSNLEWIFRELENWEAFSTSNLRRGLLAAFDRYYDPAKSIDLFLLGDDYSVGAGRIDGLVEEVAARNRERADGMPHVRIHTVAFPVFYDVLGGDEFRDTTGADLVKLMAMLSRDNAGRFLALSSRHFDTAAAASGAGGNPAAAADRVLIIVDTSANMPDGYWRQAIRTVDWLFDQAGEDARFQVVALAAPAQGIVGGTEGRWLGNENDSLRARVMTALLGMTPAGAADLGAVASIVRGLDPAPDAIYVLAAGDPAVGPQYYPDVNFANYDGAPIDLLLFGAGDNPGAVPFYWSLVLEGGGTLISPAEDWP